MGMDNIVKMFSWVLENHKNFLLNMFNNKIPDKIFQTTIRPYTESCPLTFVTEALCLAIDLA